MCVDTERIVTVLALRHFQMIDMGMHGRNEVAVSEPGTLVLGKVVAGVNVAGLIVGWVLVVARAQFGVRIGSVVVRGMK